MSQPARATIESALKEGASHVEKLQRGERLLSMVFPLDAAKMQRLDEETVEHLDQFIYRFTKLQDSMARRLLPSLYTYLEADSAPRPFLDILHRLEQLGVIASVARWQEFRNVRNNLAHDYPESIEQTVSTLNELYESWHDLEHMFYQARDYYRERA